MKILLLGGTSFVGRSIVEKLQQNKGFEIYLFNRNKTNTDLFPELKRITGDRETKEVEKIAEDDWDAIIDVSAYFPDSLNTVLSLLEGKTKKYIFISTASVYDFEKIGRPIKEEDLKVSCSDAERNDKTMHTYGKRKMACEELFASHEINYTILRPSIIYGPHDYTDRLYYWIYRIKNCNHILLPENGNFKLNLSYMGDISNCIEYLLQHETSDGVYNISTHPVIPFKTYLDIIEKLLDKYPSYHSVSKTEIEKRKLSFPLYHGNLLQIDNSKIQNELHLQFTDLESSLEKTISYYADKNFPLPKAGMTIEEEQALLEEIK
jgi:2'-hydroxyisoflavone reductase